MKVFFISPIEHRTPLLFDTMFMTFLNEGHEIVDDVKDANVVFFDLHTRIGGYNEIDLEVVLKNRLPIVYFDAWDYGAMSKDRWPFQFHITVWSFMQSVHKNKQNRIWFVRKMDKAISYPDYVYPYELIMYPDHDFPVTTKEKLFSRPNDICFIGNTSPTRDDACKLLDGHFKCKFVLGQQRLPHEAWLSEHRKSKLFLEACGGGFGSERPYQLITIAPMLRVKRNQLVVNDFNDTEDCIEMNDWTHNKHWEDTKRDIDKIGQYLNDPDKLYSIYLKGIEKMKNYYNAEFRAKYILQILKDNGIN